MGNIISKKNGLKTLQSNPTGQEMNDTYLSLITTHKFYLLKKTHDDMKNNTKHLIFEA